jgi:hypothetical protein
VEKAPEFPGRSLNDWDMTMMSMSISSVSLTKLLTIGAALALAILIVGGAVAERVQNRAVNDRFFMGDLGGGDLGAPNLQTLRVANND